MLSRDRSLQRPQLIELVRQLVTLGRIGHRRDVGFGRLDHCSKRIGIEILEWHSRVREDGQARRIDLGKASDNHDAQLAVVTMNGHDPRSQRRHERRMTGKNPEITLRTRYIDLIDVTREQYLFGRYEIDVESGHGSPEDRGRTTEDR